MPKNTVLRIALVVVLVILLYYLVITLGRSAAGASAGPAPRAEHLHRGAGDSP